MPQIFSQAIVFLLTKTAEVSLYVINNATKLGIKHNSEASTPNDLHAKNDIATPR